MSQGTNNAAAILAEYEARRFELLMFMNGVRDWFEKNPRLNAAHFPIVHSVKARLKAPDHLTEKVKRKATGGAEITAQNLMFVVTDLAGVRVLHLHQEQFRDIHDEIVAKSANLGDWFISEQPKAYTWDPESRDFFESLGIVTQLKESFYTSVHYLIRPRQDSPLCCEVQVRTLFEEIWGEVDHALNYPEPSEIIACREQLRVLAKVVGAGSRLVDSIFRTAATPQS